MKKIQDNGQIRKYKMNDGRTITIDVSDENEIVVRDNSKNEIGKIALSYRDDDFPCSSAHYHITWMYLDLIDSSYKHKGIGREALIFFQEIWGLPITASENDGLKHDDGSHLTGDAPGFLEKMIEEGVIDGSVR